MNLLCRLFGHAKRDQNRWSKPSSHFDLIEVAVTRASGVQFAAQAGARGYTIVQTKHVCIRCEEELN